MKFKFSENGKKLIVIKKNYKFGFQKHLANSTQRLNM